jgi:hypothetical protein
LQKVFLALNWQISSCCLTHGVGEGIYHNHFKNTGPHFGQLKCDVIFNGPFKTGMEWSKDSLIIFKSNGMNAS